MIPAANQLHRSYPVILEMLAARGYDVHEYPPLTLEHIDTANQKHLQTGPSPDKPLSPIPPIVVRGDSARTRVPFGPGSRETRELHGYAADADNVAVCSSAFRKRYPVLAGVVDGCADVGADHPTAARACIDACVSLYREVATPVAEVHFHQCFNPENLWGANSRDRKFMAEMQAMTAAMEATASTMFDAHDEALAKAFAKVPLATSWAFVREEMREEVVALFKRSRTIICGYRTRNKASETLDKKYEVHCLDLMAQHGVFVQLFNLKSLMYNVTAHELVPKQEPLDVWHDGEEVECIQRTYNIRNFAKELPVIPLNDPVAKFIGLRRGQLSKTTRINDTGGTYVGYRWCK